MKQYKVDYQVSYGSGAYRDYSMIIEAETFYRAVEKFKTSMGRLMTHDSKAEVLRFELMEEQK